jgi:hypothetical protein
MTRPALFVVIIVFFRLFLLVCLGFVIIIGIPMFAMSAKHHPNMREHKNTDKDWLEISTRRKAASGKKKNYQYEHAADHHPPHHSSMSIVVIVHML